MAISEDIQKRLERGQTIVLDGAIGTELERRGVTMDKGAWCGTAMENHSDLVLDVHASYIRAGADVVTTNTYATTFPALRAAACESKFEEWNRLAVTLAHQARKDSGRDVAIAGSLSTFGDFGQNDVAELHPWFTRQAELLVESGVDILLLETLASSPEVIATMIEAATGTNLPVWLAISAGFDDSGELELGIRESSRYSKSTVFHQPLGEGINFLNLENVDALLLMHSELTATLPGVDILHSVFEGPVGAYPNAGYWLRPEWAFVDNITTGAFVAETRRWRAAGARIVGGCCGLGPEYIKALAEDLDSETASERFSNRDDYLKQ